MLSFYYTTHQPRRPNINERGGNRVIVDSHLHIFPFLDGACGFATREQHLEYLQYYIVGHGQPVLRLRDHSVVPAGSLALYDQDALGPHGLARVRFRVERNGRFVWTQDGEDRYIHFTPPSFQNNEATADAILTQMAYVGVDVGVLQNAHLYGRLNDEFARAAWDNPGKFVGLAAVNEVNAHTETELATLRRAALEQGMRGLYYANRSFLWDRYQHHLDDDRYDDFWETVASLGLVVFWEIAGLPRPTPERFLSEIDRVLRVHQRFPTLRAVLTHGLTPADVLNPAEPIERLFALDRLTIEVLYPIYWGRDHDYPYPELRPVLRALHQRVGATRLCWGSDLPNVERSCTYRQSLDYLRRLADFMSPSELDLVLGDNLAELFQLV
jgi:predicted TIM-barrel fold metal-dependent hydrolase